MGKTIRRNDAYGRNREDYVRQNKNDKNRRCQKATGKTREEIHASITAAQAKKKSRRSYLIEED